LKPMNRFIAFACLAWTIGLPAASASPAQEIILGAPSSLTTLEGKESLQAVRMAVDEINGAGGVKVGGRRLKFRLEPFDLAETQPATVPSQAVARLQGFINARKPHAIVIGPFRSEVLLASMDLLARHRIPTLGCIAMSPAVDAKILSDPKYKYIFRVGLSTKYLADYMIEAMKLMKREFGFSKVYVLNQDVAWARSTAYLMIKLYFERSGWQVLGQSNHAASTINFMPDLEAAKAGGAQVLLAIFDMPSSGNLIRQWHQLKPPAILCGFISPATGPKAWSVFGSRLTGLANVIFELGNMPSAKHPPATIFYRSFKAKYGHPIQAGHGPAPAYESVYILAEALERAGSLDPDLLARALEATDRRGVMGRVRFHRGHQAIFGKDPDREALACVMQWSPRGERVIVYPRLLSEGMLKLPSFVKPAGKRLKAR
jgi:branched-chain amino acid transport system substrate-binding protein